MSAMLTVFSCFYLIMLFAIVVHRYNCWVNNSTFQLTTISSNATFGGRSRNITTNSYVKQKNRHVQSRITIVRTGVGTARSRETRGRKCEIAGGKETNGTTPSDETERLYQEAVSNLAQKDKEITRLRSNLGVLTEEHWQLSVEMKTFKDQVELEFHRAMAKERGKW